MRSEQRHRRQPQLDWNRGAQLRALDRLEFPTGLSGDDGRPVSELLVRTTLRALDSFAGSKGDCWPALETLRQRIGCRSIRSVQRALHALQELGLILAWEERSPRGHKQIGWSIDWQVIFSDGPLTARSSGPGAVRASVRESLPATAGRVQSAPQHSPDPGRVPSPAAEKPPDTGSRPPDTGSRPPDTGSRPPDTGSRPHKDEAPREAHKEPSPSAPHGGEEEEELHARLSDPLTLTLATVEGQFGRRGRVLPAGGTDWREIETALARRGMLSRSCLRTARRRITPDHCAELIAWWDEHRDWWAPEHALGVLHLRIAGALPALAVEEAWREPVPWRKERWEAQQRAQLAQHRDATSPAGSAVPADTEPASGAASDGLPVEERQRLLEQLSRSELLDLAESAGPYCAQWLRQRGLTAVIVPLLWREFENRQQQLEMV